MFTEKFVEILQTRNITPYQVAKSTGISQGLMGEYKNGIKFPTINNLIKIANYLEVSIDFLLGRENIKGENTMEQNSKISFYIVFNTALAYQIERLCREKNISVSEMIKNRGLENGFLTYLKNLNEPISFAVLEKVSDFFKISVEELLEQTKTIDEEKHKILKLEDWSFLKNSLNPLQMEQVRKLTNDMNMYDKYTLLDNIEKYQISTMYIKSVYSDNDSFVNKQSDNNVRIVARQNRTKPAVQKKKPRKP